MREEGQRRLNEFGGEMSWRGGKEEALQVPQAPLKYLCREKKKKDKLKGNSGIFKARPYVYIFWLKVKVHLYRVVPVHSQTATKHAAVGKQHNP